MNNKNDSNNREQWLTLAAQLITSTIIQPNSNKPLITDYRVSIAPPTQKCAAQCHNRASSTASINEVFISGQTDDSLKICADLTHELVHVQDDCQSAHRGYFRATMEKIGFKTPMTATHLDNASDAIRHQLAEIVELLGPIPHAAMITANMPKQKGRNGSKIECYAIGCEFKANISNKWVAEIQANNTATPMKLKCPVCSQNTMTLNIK